MAGRIGFLAALAMLALAFPAQAEQRFFLRQQQLTQCANENNEVTPEVSIRACTYIIRTQGSPDTLRAQAFNLRGQRYLALGEPERALEDFSMAIRTSPTMAAAYMHRGELRLSRREYARAVVDYSDAILYAPEDSGGYNARCWARAMWNASLEMARADCDRALELSPGDARAFDSRGMVGLRQEQWQDAWNDYDAAVRAENHPHYLYGRGIAALRLGRTQEGQSDLAAAAALDASVPELYAGYGIRP
ncbi:tetratricopeptide repeat protein [Terricaulis sp.]|uniref:tetratricopeptide repeat protein n=1 Tax=Terricaulis sp. TaxID=2768686 RepID=UPI003784B6A4